MQNFLDFTSALFSNLSDFLLSEPMIYFVSILLVLFVGAIVNRIIK